MSIGQEMMRAVGAVWQRRVREAGRGDAVVTFRAYWGRGAAAGRRRARIAKKRRARELAERRRDAKRRRGDAPRFARGASPTLSQMIAGLPPDVRAALVAAALSALSGGAKAP